MQRMLCNSTRDRARFPVVKPTRVDPSTGGGASPSAFSCTQFHSRFLYSPVRASMAQHEADNAGAGGEDHEMYRYLSTPNGGTGKGGRGQNTISTGTKREDNVNVEVITLPHHTCGAADGACAAQQPMPLPCASCLMEYAGPSCMMYSQYSTRPRRRARARHALAPTQFTGRFIGVCEDASCEAPEGCTLYCYTMEGQPGGHWDAALPPNVLSARGTSQRLVSFWRSDI